MLASRLMNQTPVTQISFYPRVDHTQWIGALVLVAATLLYGLTLDNGLRPGELAGGDLITHQYAQVQARPSNAPGYPLYTMGGWFWFHGLRTLLVASGLTAPNPIPLLSSYSTLWALLALWLFYRILCMITRSPTHPHGNGWLAGLLCAFYSVTYFFWYYATTTEQYSSAIAQTLAIVYLYLRWQSQQQTEASGAPARPTRSSPFSASSLTLVGLALLCGLSLAHMVTVAFMVPPLLFVILWQAPQVIRSLRLVGSTILAVFLPLLSYLYVYWRGAGHPEWWGNGQWESPQAWFWAFVSTAQGRAELGWGFDPACTFFANGFPSLIWQELSLPLVLLGMGGIVALGKRQAAFLYGTCVIYLIFCWAYRCGNWFQVILPVYPLLLMGVAAAFQRLAARLHRQKQWGRLFYTGALLCLLFAIGWRFTLSWPIADSRNRPEDSAFDRAALLLAQPLPSGAPLFAAVADTLALQYLSAIWQVRPDVAIITSADAAQRLRAGQPVYSTWEAAPTLRAELPSVLTPIQQAVDPYWTVFYPTTLAMTWTPVTTLNQPLTNEIVLHGYTIAPVPPSPLRFYRPAIAATTDGLVVTLFWQTPKGAWPAGVSISVRPIHDNGPLPDGNGGHWQQDRQQPAVALYRLLPGSNQPLVDPYHFALPAATVGTVDQVQLLLYRTSATGFENLAELRLPLLTSRP